MSEAALQSRICQLLELHGWLPLESDRAGMGRGRRGAFMVGFPDVLALRGEEFLLLELKTPRGKVRGEQRDLHTRLAALGITTHVCRSEDDLLALLRGRTRRREALSTPGEEYRP